MRRLILVLMVALLPFQLTWASVAFCCGHNTPTSAQHASHPPHPHPITPKIQSSQDALADSQYTTSIAPNDAVEVDEPPVAQDMVNMDCNHGHCHCPNGAILNPQTCPLSVFSSPRPMGLLNQAAHEPAAHRPERPQWQPLA